MVFDLDPGPGPCQYLVAGMISPVAISIFHALSYSCQAAEGHLTWFDLELAEAFLGVTLYEGEFSRHVAARSQCLLAGIASQTGWCIAAVPCEQLVGVFAVTDRPIDEVGHCLAQCRPVADQHRECPEHIRLARRQHSLAGEAAIGGAY